MVYHAITMTNKIVNLFENAENLQENNNISIVFFFFRKYFFLYMFNFFKINCAARDTINNFFIRSYILLPYLFINSIESSKLNRSYEIRIIINFETHTCLTTSNDIINR